MLETTDFSAASSPRHHTEEAAPPAVILHGGITTAEDFSRHAAEKQAALREIAHAAQAMLSAGAPALEVVVEAVRQLEDCPLFNAGTGATIQSDGVIRLSAALMDGQTRIFSGVMNIQAIQNPILLAKHLQGVPDRVLAGAEAEAYARALGIPHYNPETAEKREDFAKRHRELPTTLPLSTVGCVARDSAGRLAAATSTGGKGFEIPGRVSDSATIAGNYATAEAAVSCTGVGEHIVSAGLAAALVTRVSEGMALTAARDKALSELRDIQGYAGAIVLTRKGQGQIMHTHPYLTWARADAYGVEVYS